MGNCACYFIKKVNWIEKQRKSEIIHQGLIRCFNCAQQLGFYNDKGLKCNCGQYVKPAFQILKSKIQKASQFNVTKMNLLQQNEDLKLSKTCANRFPKLQLNSRQVRSRRDFNRIAYPTKQGTITIDQNYNNKVRGILGEIDRREVNDYRSQDLRGQLKK